MVQRLWAPWRMQYILENDGSNECFLCVAARSADDRANLVVYRGGHCFCILNRYPYNNGHILIAPYAHKADFGDLDDPERVEMLQAMARMQSRLRRAMNPDGFNVAYLDGSVGFFEDPDRSRTYPYGNPLYESNWGNYQRPHGFQPRPWRAYDLDR